MKRKLQSGNKLQRKNETDERRRENKTDERRREMCFATSISSSNHLPPRRLTDQPKCPLVKARFLSLY